MDVPDVVRKTFETTAVPLALKMLTLISGLGKQGRPHQ